MNVTARLLFLTALYDTCPIDELEADKETYKIFLIKLWLSD